MSGLPAALRHGATLSAAALADGEASRWEELARHIRRAHGPGAAVGLEVDQNTLSPGLAHDADGRQLVVDRALEIDPAVDRLVAESGANPRGPGQEAKIACPPPGRIDERARPMPGVGDGLAFLEPEKDAHLPRAGARGEVVTSPSGRMRLSLAPSVALTRTGGAKPDVVVDPATGSVGIAQKTAVNGRATVPRVRFPALQGAAPQAQPAARPWQIYRVPAAPGAPQAPTLRLELEDPGENGDASDYALQVTIAGGLAFAADAAGNVWMAIPEESQPQRIRQPVRPDPTDPEFLQALVDAYFRGAAAATSESIVFGEVRLSSPGSPEGVTVEVVGTSQRTTTVANGTFVIGQVGPPGQHAVVRFSRSDLAGRTVFAVVGAYFHVQLDPA